MGLRQRLEDVRTGFERPFWIANLSEIFERLSYYAVFAVLVRYLHEALGFPLEQATTLGGWFGGAPWFLAAFGGAAADLMGFRRALSLAYFTLSCAYFMVGLIAAPWLAPVRGLLPLGPLVFIILLLPAIGIALVKPCVVGTTGRASREDVRSIGYSIYYTMVNIGSFLGPTLAGWVHQHMRVENVFRLAALSVFLMFVAVLLFFREPRRDRGAPAASLGDVARGFLSVLGNPRFMIFLLIFSGYWVVFWQQYLVLPSFIHDHVDASANTGYILSADPLVVIFFTVAINVWTRRIPAFAAVVIGTLVTSLAWLFLALHPSVFTAVAALIVLATGEIIQSPRYYEYISRLAPPGQQGTYMGFAFLPIGIGSIVGGKFGGRVMLYFGGSGHPERVWWAITAVGVATALLLLVYDRLAAPAPKESAPRG